MSTMFPFYLAFPVTSLDKARAFYGGLLGCPEGRSSPEWVDFDIEPHIRFKSKAGEQATMFFLDPCGNAIEFKAFENPEMLFAK